MRLVHRVGQVARAATRARLGDGLQVGGGVDVRERRAVHGRHEGGVAAQEVAEAGVAHQPVRQGERLALEQHRRTEHAIGTGGHDRCPAAPPVEGMQERDVHRRLIGEEDDRGVGVRRDGVEPQPQ